MCRLNEHNGQRNIDYCNEAGLIRTLLVERPTVGIQAHFNRNYISTNDMASTSSVSSQIPAEDGRKHVLPPLKFHGVPL